VLGPGNRHVISGFAKDMPHMRRFCRPQKPTGIPRVADVGGFAVITDVDLTLASRFEGQALRRTRLFNVELR
jgi:hypothetical protein